MIILLQRIETECEGDVYKMVVRANSPQEAMELAANHVSSQEANVWRSPSQIRSFLIEPEGKSEVIFSAQICL